MSGWNRPIGPVTLKTSCGQIISAQTLLEAIRACRRHRIVEAFSVLADPAPQPWSPHQIIILDECGLVVPLWRIAQEAQGVDLSPASRRRAGYLPERHFRNHPVPNTRRWRRGRHYRNIRTHSERRDMLGLEADLHDLEEFADPVKLRARRKALPSAWDDIRVARRGESWKHYRKTRYK